MWKNVTEYTPFIEGNAKRLSTIGYKISLRYVCVLFIIEISEVICLERET
jgi:hypothetical protein